MEATQALEDILPAKERTRTVDVMVRVVGKPDGVYQEKEIPEQVFVRPMPFRRWPQVIGHVSNLLQYMPSDGIDLNDTSQVIVWVGSLINVASDSVFEVLQLATDRPPEFFDQIDPDDGIKIMAAVIEVNKDFFDQNVMPLISKYLPAVTETFGQTQLPS